MFSTTATSYMLIVRVYVHNPLTMQIPERKKEHEKERERVKERMGECEHGKYFDVAYIYIHTYIYIFKNKEMTERANCESRLLHMHALYANRREKSVKKKRKKRNEQWSKSIICNTCTNH